MGNQQVKYTDRPIKVWAWLRNSSSRADAPVQIRPVTSPHKPSIAALAFDNMSTDPALDHFCTGLSESLNTDLSKSELLTVAARNASFDHAGKGINVIAVGRAESAKAAISMALDQNAHQTMAVVERGCLPYRDRSIAKRLCGLIRAAGLPEA